MTVLLRRYISSFRLFTILQHYGVWFLQITEQNTI